MSLHPLHGKMPYSSEAWTFPSSVGEKSYTVPMGAKCPPYIDVNDMQEFTWGEMYGVGANISETMVRVS